MRAFYLAYREILRNVPGQLAPTVTFEKVQTVSGQFMGNEGLACVHRPKPIADSGRTRSVIPT